MIVMILKAEAVLWVLGRKRQMYFSSKFSASVMLKSIEDKVFF